MRVLHLLDTAAFAGTERHVIQLLSALRTVGVSPVLACRPNSPLCTRATNEELEVWPRLGARPGPRGIARLWRLVRDQKYDIVHAHNGRTSLTTALLASTAGICGVMTQHFIEPAFASQRGPKRAISDLAHHWVKRRLTRICCISDATREAMLLREGVPPQKLITVRNGIESLPELNDERRATVRASIGVADSGLLIVCVARLEPEKGHEILLDALPEVVRAFPGTKVAVVGDGSTRTALEDRARTLGLAATVVFAGFREDAAALTGACDLFVLPSPVEPFGLAIVEAMSVAKPVIACRAGGPREIIDEDVSGLLVPPRDSAAMASAICRLLGDAELRIRLGEAGRTAFTQRFTAERMARDTLEVYQAVLRERARTDSLSPAGAAR